MTLNSILFIFTFLPILLIVYRFIPYKYRNRLLIAASLLFYGWGEPFYVLLLIISLYYTFRVCLRLDDRSLSDKQRKSLFIQVIFIHVFFLIYLKYYGFLLDSVKQIFHSDITYQVLPQPLGISFYTFMILSYVIDVYNHKNAAEKNFEIFAVYVTFFPKLLMGPIERFKDMKEQIIHPAYTTSVFSKGVERFIVGLAKKVILADSFGLIWSEISALGISELSIVSAWIGAIAYTLQIYFDFSGYTDMAIGISKMFGFHLMENFHYPYMACSIKDFWRRWHISLSSWFRDYIYIPLGGNRVDKRRHIINIMIVWSLTGIWHGAAWNFIIWGIYYGILLLLEKYIFASALKKLSKPWRWLLTFVLVMIGWVLFASDNLGSAIQYLSVMFFISGHSFIDLQAQWLLSTNSILLILGFVCMTPLGAHVIETCKSRKPQGEYFTIGIYTMLLLAAMAFLVSQSYQSFLYTQF